MSGEPREGPYLAVDLNTKGAEKMLRMMSYMDSGAHGDIVGRNWVASLELHGGIVEPLPAAMRAEWLDPKVIIDVHDMVRMDVGIAGTSTRMAVTFLVAPGI